MSTSDRLVIRSRFRDYEVTFVEDFSTILASRTEHGFFIVDKVVMELYRPRLQSLLPAGRTFLVEATERQKTLEHCQGLIGTLIESNIRKHHRLVALGGGVIQDITAFIASILFRGVQWSFFPTTLLAQADSCVGSKSSLNLGKYKNLLGTFYPPSQIWIDVGFLQTLPADEIKSGIGEILHFYLVDGNERISSLMDNYDEHLKNPRGLHEHIRTALEIKKKTVELDEFDQHQRNLFNYGHTFGHAIETVSGYRIRHGQAVTMGMDIANYVSCERGYLPKATFVALHQILAKNMPVLSLDSICLDDYFTALSKDKKNVSSHLTCILTSGPGSMKKAEIPLDDDLKDILSAYIRTYGAPCVSVATASAPSASGHGQ